MKQRSKARFLPAILAFLLVLGTGTVFRSCGFMEDGTPMSCHHAQMVSMGLGCVLIAAFLATALISSPAVRRMISIAALIVSVVIFLIPGTIIPLCMMNTMRCHVYMQPFVRIMAVVMCLCAVITLLRAGRAK